MKEFAIYDGAILCYIIYIVIIMNIKSSFNVFPDLVWGFKVRGCHICVECFTIYMNHLTRGRTHKYFLFPFPFWTCIWHTKNAYGTIWLFLLQNKIIIQSSINKHFITVYKIPHHSRMVNKLPFIAFALPIISEGYFCKTHWTFAESVKV